MECVGRLASASLKVWRVGGSLLERPVHVFLTETGPDNLSCLDGFMMFTDVLSL